MRVDRADAPQRDDDVTSYRYDAFISYSHEDRAVAQGVQRGLHRIGKRLGQLRALRVFRDSTDLTATPDLWGKVVEAIDGSRYMIAVLSPHAAQSHWVDREIGYWLDHRGPDRLMYVVAGGTVRWDEDCQRFEPRISSAAAPLLLQPGALPAEPFYVDVTADAPWDVATPLFREKVTDLAAPIHGKPKYELAGEDLREQRRFQRLRRAVIAGLALLTVVAVVAAALAFDQKREAVRQRNAAEDRFREATASRLAIESQAMLTGARARDDVRALQEALASQRVARNYDPGALLGALGATSDTTRIIRVAAPLVGGLTIQSNADGRMDAALSVAISRDGSRIISGGKRIRTWNALTGQPVSPTGYGFVAKSVAVSPDGRHVASGSVDNSVGLWDTESGARIGEPLTGHAGPVSAVAFSSDGHRLVSASADKTVRLWDADTGAGLGIIASDATALNAVAISPDGRQVVSGGVDGTVRVSDVDTRTAVQTWNVGQEVTSVAFGPNHRVVSADNGGGVRIFDVESNLLAEPLPTNSRNPVAAVAFSPDGRLVAFGGFGQRIEVWDVETRASARPAFIGHTGWITGVGFTGDGKQLVSSSYDGTVRLWDATDDGSVGDRPLGLDPDPVPRSVALAPDSHRMVAGFRDGTMSVFETDTGRPIGRPMLGHVGRVTVAAFSPDGRVIASGGDDGTVRFWNALSGAAVGVPTAHGAKISDLVFSPDGKRVASASDDGAVQFWDPETGVPMAPPTARHRGSVSAMAFGPDGHRLATGGEDGRVQVWDADTAAPQGDPLVGHERMIYRVAFANDGRAVVSLSSDSLRRWDATTGTALGSPMLPDPNIFTGLAVSPDGRVIVTSGFGVVQRWDAVTGAEIGAPMNGHTALVPAVGFSSDGRYLVSAGDDDTLRFWNAHTGLPVGEPLRLTGLKASKLSFSADDRRLLTWGVGPNGGVEVRMWPGPAGWRDDLCTKLSANTSLSQWNEWVSADIPREKLCDGLPDLPDDIP